MVRCIRCSRRSWGFCRTLAGRFITAVLLILMLTALFNVYISYTYLGHAKQGMSSRDNTTAGESLLGDHALKAILRSTQHPWEGLGFITKPMLLDMNSTIAISPWGVEEGKHFKHVCGMKVYDSLPQASVIITFVEHETLSYLLHTIHSIVQRTPPELLKEIILVDDNSTKDNLKTILDNYVTSVFPGRVKILRPNKHLGLIRARLHGIQEAKGDVIAVMDSHMEVQEKWLEPLLHEIQKDRKTLASSYLDWMKKVDGDGGSQIWEYMHGSSTCKTFFDWSLEFGFQDISDKAKRARHGDITAGIPTPCMVGGIFAMEKRFFHEIGGFDSGMQAWGGENIDLSLRAWLCGGQVINVPCSHVAHLELKDSRSYRNKWTALIEMNYKRVAEVWFDDYKKYFYMMRPHLKSVNVTDISERLALRKQCPHDMSWLLKNVYPELGVPDQNSYAWGGLENVGVKGCLDTLYGITLRMYTCNGSPRSQGLFWNKRGELRMSAYIFNPLPPGEVGAHLDRDEYMRLYNTTLNSKWFHVQGSVFMDTNSGLCLEASYSDATLQKCNYTSPSQQWTFQHYTPDYNELKTLKVTADSNVKDLHVALAVFVQETRKVLNKDSHTTRNARGK